MENDYLNIFTIEPNEFGASERFSQLVLGLHGDHCIQVFCRLRKEGKTILSKVSTGASVPSGYEEHEFYQVPH